MIAYLSTLRFWPEAADVGVATVVVAGAELLAGMVGEVDITRTFLSHNAKVVPSRWFCFRASCLFAQALITDQFVLFVKIYQTRASLPQKLLQKLINTEMNSEIEKRNLFSHERRSTSSKMAKKLPIFTCKSTFQNEGLKGVSSLEPDKILTFCQKQILLEKRLFSPDMPPDMHLCNLDNLH